MPIVSGKLHVGDALLLTLISVTESLGFLLSPFTSNLKLFYVCQILCTTGNCKFSIGRSLGSILQNSISADNFSDNFFTP
jgi:hypothetical protein